MPRCGATPAARYSPAAATLTARSSTRRTPASAATAARGRCVCCTVLYCTVLHCTVLQVCLLYTWQRSRAGLGVVRECVPRATILGPIAAPLTVAASCEPRDISDGDTARVTLLTSASQGYS